MLLIKEYNSDVKLYTFDVSLNVKNTGENCTLNVCTEGSMIDSK